MKLKSLMCLSVLFASTVTLVLTSEADAQVIQMVEELVVGERGPDDPEPPPKPPKKCYKFDFDVELPEGHSCEKSADEKSCIQHVPNPNGQPDGFSRCPGIVTQQIVPTVNECVDCKKGAKGCKACKLEDRKYKKLVAVGALVCREAPEDGECSCKWELVPDIDDDWLEKNGFDPDFELPIWEFIEVEAPSGVKCKDAMIDVPEIDIEQQDIEDDI